MKSSQYLAVFKSLSYAGQVKNRFWSANQPEIIKTPQSIFGGCSYALIFREEQLNDMLRIVREHKKGFLGIFYQKKNGRYEELNNDLPG